MFLQVSYKKKNMKKQTSFCILKVTEERSLIQSWIWIHQSLEMRIRICTKMSRIPNTACWSNTVFCPCCLQLSLFDPICFQRQATRPSSTNHSRKQRKAGCRKSISSHALFAFIIFVHILLVALSLLGFFNIF